MTWDTVVKAIVKAWRADTTLMTAIGSDIEAMESNVARKIPSLRYSVIADTQDETLNPILLQVDYWARNRSEAATIERKIRFDINAGTLTSFDGVSMWVLFVEGRDADDPQPGVVHRSLDFRCVPVRAD